MRLTEADYLALEQCYITRELAQAADITRLSDMEGRERMGRNHGPGDFSGLRFPYRFPGEAQVTAERLRVDHPPIDFATQKSQFKYLTPPRQRNRIYFPLADPAWLRDPTLDIVIGEGEKKYLALHHAALEGAIAQNSNGGSAGARVLYMAMSFSGVWSWRGQVGIATNSSGRRVPEKGVIPDLDFITWKDRRVMIVYDSNVLTNEKVRAARWALARELESRGARVFLVDLPVIPGINGPDDYLAVVGLLPFLSLLNQGSRYDWRSELARSEKGKLLINFSNVLTALRLAPAWHGVLGFNEFALTAEARKPPPWIGCAGYIGPWSDDADLRTLEWLEKQGLPVSHKQAADAIQTVAHEHPFHPVREYLDGLQWDGVPRIDTWLTEYVGAKANSYTRAVGSCWMKSTVARIYEPGCKADCALVLEGPQGAGKSTAFEILGGEFYAENTSDLTTKDAILGLLGVWIVEFPELDAMSRTEVTRVKAFLSCHTDHFRPPYGKHAIDAPRQCSFGGTVNLKRYLKDETGGRRFWPAECGEIRTIALQRDRDMLWAEAVVRYKAGEKWWLDTTELIEEAGEEQEERYAADPWEELARRWLDNQADGDVDVQRVLSEAIKKDPGQWTRADESRVGAILHRLGWEVGQRVRDGGKRIRKYRRKGEPAQEPIRYHE